MDATLLTLAETLVNWRAWKIRAAVNAVLLGLLCVVRIAAAEPEDELKTATILTFLRNAEWPGSGGSIRPVTVGVLGRPPLVRTLNRLLDGKLVNNRPIRIVEVKGAPDPQSCDVLYVATGNNAEIRQALATPRLAHALTIGEADRFLEYGGAVNLMIVDGHMSFEVSMEALDRSGVTISAKLLRYGQIKRKP